MVRQTLWDGEAAEGSVVASIQPSFRLKRLSHDRQTIVPIIEYAELTIGRLFENCQSEKPKAADVELEWHSRRRQFRVCDKNGITGQTLGTKGKSGRLSSGD